MRPSGPTAIRKEPGSFLISFRDTKFTSETSLEESNSSSCSKRLVQLKQI